MDVVDVDVDVVVVLVVLWQVVHGSSRGNLDFLGSYEVCGINAMTVPCMIWETDTVVGPNN